MSTLRMPDPRRLLLALLLALALYAGLTATAGAEGNAGLEDDGAVYAAVDADGAPLFSLCARISEGDEYISGDNTLYRVVSVSGTTAVCERVGEETMPDVSWLTAGEAQAVFAPVGAADGAPSGEDVAAASEKVSGEKRLIALYATHSDESYVPSDGTQSIEGRGGIYDVARAFRDALEAQGIDVVLDETTHLPHDSGAYRRSRQTAERLLQKRPDAIIDIHRDGIPDEGEYELSIGGEAASRVRLLVGRGNQNSAVNRDFAKQLKAVADKKYPGLVKDIFIGKGNYNQDLSPNAILLEFGTHTLSKQRAVNSTDMMAQVVSAALYGAQTGSAKQAKTASSGSTKGIVWLLLAVVVGVLLFALAQTGGGTAMRRKLSRNASELTGGLLGKKPDEN